jgi:hypothetical protein
MTGRKPENPLAFPHHEVWDDEKPEIGWIGGGMTLRDYFAAKAMQGILVNSEANSPGAYLILCETVAQLAYSAADAMLVERSKA